MTQETRDRFLSLDEQVELKELMLSFARRVLAPNGEKTGEEVQILPQVLEALYRQVRCKLGS